MWRSVASNALTLFVVVLAVGPLVLGVPHLVADLRYLVVRPGLHRRAAFWPVAVSALASSWFGLVPGLLAAGLAADIVIFDPDTVACGPLERVYDLPAGADRLRVRAEGIEAVLVNGVMIHSAGEDLLEPGGALPGRLLRGGAALS